MTVDSSNSRIRRLMKCPRVKCDRACASSLLKHSCWTAVILGAVMLTLGIVLRTSVVSNHPTTVTSSGKSFTGLLFILIGVFIICMGPFAAIYDLIAHRKTTRREAETRMGSPRPSQAIDPPSYNQVMTDIKTPSATYSMRFSELSAKDLFNSEPHPPSYEEVSENDSSPYLSPYRDGTQDIRRMTSP